MTIITQYQSFSNINSELYVKIYLGDWMKKTNIFMGILTTLGLSILTSFVLAMVYEFVRNWNIAYIICYLMMIIFLGKRFKSELIDNAKRCKSDLKNNWLNIIFFTLTFTIMLYIASYVIIKSMNRISANEIMARNQLKSSPFLRGMILIFLAPIVEEMIYRLPYSHINKHKLLNFFIYSLIFALAHIATNNGIKELIYLIPYMFLSMSIGYSFYKTNNIYLSMIVHILNNFINVMVLLIM